MKPKVSIVMNTLNRKEGLRKALMSVRNQLFAQPFEVHIVDGGSTDGSTELFDEFSDIITTAISEKDRGIYHAINKGIEKCKGDYVFVLPSGDYFHNNMVFSRFFNEEQNADILYGDLIVAKRGYLSRVRTDLTKFLQAKDCLHHQASFVRKSVFEKHGLLPENSYIGEQIFFLQLLYDRAVILQYIPHPVCVYDFNDGFSVRNSDKGTQEMQRFVASRNANSTELLEIVESALYREKT